MTVARKGSLRVQVPKGKGKSKLLFAKKIDTLMIYQ